MSKVDLKKIAEQLVDLSVLEVNELNQILEDEHGIKPAAAPAMVAAVASGEGAEGDGQPAQKDKYNVVLKEAGEQKIAVIKAVKELTEMALGDAKALVEGAPKNIKDGVPKEEAEDMKAKLEEAGATVELV